MSEIKAGDIVHLKSGGQPMSVEFVDNDGLAHCAWFAASDFKTAVIRSAALQVVKKTERLNFGELGERLA